MVAPERRLGLFRYAKPSPPGSTLVWKATMKVEMLEGEREILTEMMGDITPQCAKFYGQIRRRLLKVGSNYDMSRETLALIVELSVAATNYTPERKEKIEVETNGHDITPVDEMSQSELDEHVTNNQALDPDAAGGEYKGSRIKWETEFKSTPDTPVSKLEKGRPISFIDPKDNKRYFGRFVRVAPKDKRNANVLPNGKKVPFAVPIKNIEITDLSPPSTIPLAVQI